MNFNHRRNFLLCLSFIAVLFFAFPPFEISGNGAKNIDYFKGQWLIKLRGNPEISGIWRLGEGLNGMWLTGAVEVGGKPVTNDFWRVNKDKIERMAFTSDGYFVKVESSGWKSDKLIFEGTASNASGESKVRETITKTDENQFNALWEMQDANGKWRVFSDEICTREKQNDKK